MKSTKGDFRDALLAMGKSSYHEPHRVLSVRFFVLNVTVLTYFLYRSRFDFTFYGLMGKMWSVIVTILELL